MQLLLSVYICLGLVKKTSAPDERSVRLSPVNMNDSIETLYYTMMAPRILLIRVPNKLNIDYL